LEYKNSISGSKRLIWEAGHIMKNKLLDLSVGAKIVIYYLLTLLLSVLLSAFLYQQALSGTITNKVSGLSMQMLQSVSANFVSMIETAAEYSKLIMNNEEVQDGIRKCMGSYDFYYQYKVNAAMNRFIGETPLISSAYIFDNYGNKYDAYKESIRVLKINRIEDAEWFNAVHEKGGAYIIRLNSGGALQQLNPHNNYISVIREINDLHTQKPMGIILVNVPELVVRKACQRITGSYDMGITIMDDNNNIMMNLPNKAGIDISQFADVFSSKESGWFIKKSGNTEYLISHLKIKETGWKLASIMPYRELSKETAVFSLIAFCVLAVNSILLFIGSIFISRRITEPIKKLLNSMKGIEKGEFNKVDINIGNDEIGKLRDGYNTMICEIQKLLARTLEEQKIKRKAELNALQSQIKPHFLYNTFDAISSLALSGKNQDVYIMMKALGNYYRTSLGKGREVITIGEELDVVKNYLIILKYRYEDMFTVVYDVDENILNHKILKLVLQPFVENALYHGIRPKGTGGTIRVSARDNGDHLLLCIEDDGVGMSSETVTKLMSGRIQREKPGFGIWGTIERLRIFYGVDNIVNITSTEGSGTVVELRIPLFCEYEEVY